MAGRKPYEYQERRELGWCGPATLSMGLAAVGIDVAQEKLAKQSNYGEWGVENSDMLATAKLYVPNAYIVIGKNLEELAEIGKKNAVIVQFVDTERQDENSHGVGRGDDSHYVMLNGLTKDKVLVVDPNPISGEYGGFRKIDRTWFERHFWDEDRHGGITKGWALVIPAN